MQELRERLVFGCCSLSANNTKKRALKILKFARNLGFKFFDTAPLYSKGYSELLLGSAFKNDIEVNIMNKIGKYSVPKTLIPSKFALPLNSLKKSLLPKRNNNYSDQKKLLYLDNDYENHFKKQIINSNKKLNGINIEGILFHEINPYNIELKLIENIKEYLNLFNINKLGYAGIMPKEFLENSIPEWMEIIQIEIPMGLNKFEKNKLFNMIKKNIWNISKIFFNIY